MSEFFGLHKLSKRKTSIWFVIPLILVVFFLGAFIGINVLSILSAIVTPNLETTFNFSEAGSVRQGLLLAFIYGAPVFVLLAWLHLFEKRPLTSLGFEKTISGLIKFAKGAFYGFIAMALIVEILALTGFAEVRHFGIPDSWALIVPILILLVGWIIQGSAEEILIRGYIFQAFGAKYGLAIGIIVSSLLFTAFHLANANVTPLLLGNLILFSIFAALYVIRENSLWGICGCHAFWNLTQGNIFGMPVSGSYSGKDRLFSIVETGPDFITGGAAGPEAGLVTTAILCLSIIALRLTPLKRAPHAPKTS